MQINPNLGSRRLQRACAADKCNRGSSQACVEGTPAGGMTFTWLSTESSKVWRSETRYMAGRINKVWGKRATRAISHARPAFTVLSRALNHEGSGYETNDAAAASH
jgi:hypothetical protein